MPSLLSLLIVLYLSDYLSDFLASIVNMFLPSNFGAFSTCETSLKFSINLFNTSSPAFELLTSLPLNLTVILTLFPSSKNFLAFLDLNPKSCSSMFGVTLISFTSNTFCFFFASFSFFASSGNGEGQG